MKKMNQSILGLFLVIAIPVTLIWIGFTINSMLKEKEFLVEKNISEKSIYDENTAVLIERYMDEIIENVKVVRDADEFNLFINAPSEKTYDDVSQMFIRIMNNKSAYDQLRYIDVDGNEIIRVNNTDNKVELVSQKNLQNKNQYYYFKESMLLNFDEIYISPLDLNIEEGVIEMPPKPMLRFATKIYDNEHNLSGILMVNYKAEYFVSLISERKSQDNSIQEDFYILNNLGQYIVHPDEHLNFSFMYNETSKLSFIDLNKSLWNEMVNSEFKGSQFVNNKIYTYYDVLEKVKAKNRFYPQSWIVLHVIDVAKLISFETIAKRLFFTDSIMVFLIIFVSSFSVAYFIERLRKKDNQLEITKRIAESTTDAVIITDESTKIQYVNKAYEEATGYTFKEVVGSKPGHFKSGRHSNEFYKNMWNDIAQTGQWEGMIWDKKKDGLLYPKKLKILAVKNKKSPLIHHYIGIFKDLSTNKRKSDTFEALDHKNGQFMVPNEEMMIELLDQSIMKDNFSFMVVYLAIENYNQLMGLITDELTDISEVFTELIQPLLHEDDFIAQTGRNLFAMIISMNHIKETPEKFVNRVHQKISKVIRVAEKDIFFKTRLGVSYWPNDTNDIKQLLLNSMIALEWTSNRQEAQIAFFNEKMIEQLNQENEIEAHLRKAIEKNEFSIVYQPQIDISTEKIVGMEALLRWTCEALGPVSPAVFIPIAEKNHLMIEIGTWVINRVCEELKNCESECSYMKRKLRCAINLSVKQMEEIGFVDKLFSIINEKGILSSQLEMEITESLLLTNETKNVETINQIRKRGMTVSIDDFGTGYSSLSYLNTMPIDKIKIDRSFIRNYPETDDGKLARVLVDMSKSMNLKVLMEGAEREDQINYLKSIGCHYVQGFYYSKPLSMDQFVDYINRQ